jgi:hypothetical protein
MTEKRDENKNRVEKKEEEEERSQVYNLFLGQKSLFLRFFFFFLNPKESIQRKVLCCLRKRERKKNIILRRRLMPYKNQKKKIIYICKYLNFFFNFLFYIKWSFIDGANRFYSKQTQISKFFLSKNKKTHKCFTSIC